MSRELASGVVQLAQSLGGVAKVLVVAPRGRARLPLHRVWISLHQEDAPFRLARKIALWEPRKVPYVRAMVNVEPVQNCETVCIRVEREDGLFLTEGLVVTKGMGTVQEEARLTAARDATTAVRHER